MNTDKPLISVLMATYEPNMDWLQQQLCSLDLQTYPNLRLYIRDDASKTVSMNDIQACIQACIHRIPYSVFQNENNLGSNGTFEYLTKEAEGDYFAYCDQDDIWLPQKLEVLYREIEKSNALLVCSDMYIIDGDNKVIADSITKVRKHHVFKSGFHLAAKLLVSNFVTGCTMLISAEQSKQAIPFCPYMVHDHYLALWCAEHGEIRSVDKPLIQYRQHGTNQTSLMAGVSDKESYYRVRIQPIHERMKWLYAYFPCSSDTKAELHNAVIWAEAREENWKHNRKKLLIWKYRRYSPMPSLFEIISRYIPSGVFRALLKAAKNNKI